MVVQEQNLSPVSWAANFAVWVKDALHKGIGERTFGVCELIKFLYLSALSLMWQKQEKGQIPGLDGSKVKCRHRSLLLSLFPEYLSQESSSPAFLQAWHHPAALPSESHKNH